MTTRSPESGARWLSFHVFLAGGHEAFLTDYLLPAVEDDLRARRVRRFFFIRYSEGGLHLRLRFLPGPAVGASSVERGLAELVRRFDGETAGGVSRLQRQPYDRAELYFGETLLSVYAELLNEHTSYLCLRLMRAHRDNRPQLFLVLASALALLLRASADGGEALRSALGESKDFAAGTAKKLGLQIGEADERVETAAGDAILRASARAAPALSRDSTVRHVARLLRRARRAEPPGPFVATHALHLFCNKLGVSIVEEYNLFRVLCRLAQDNPSFP